MNKLLLASIAVSTLTLTGCQTTQSLKDGAVNLKDKVVAPFKKDATDKAEKADADKKDWKKGEYKHKHEHKGEHKGEYKGEHKHGKHHGHHGFNPHHAHIYTCEANAKVSAVYNPHNETAQLTVTAPAWKLDNATIKDMTLSPAASGELYVNNKNPATGYQWHTKGEMGVLSVTVNGKTHSVNCEGKPMPANHPTLNK